MTSLRCDCAFIVVAFAAVACGGGSDDNSNPGGGGSAGVGGQILSGGGAGAGGVSSGGSGNAPSCPDGPGYPSTDPPHLVKTFVGKVIDQDGNPAKKMLATVCGVDICIYGSTDDQGVVVTCDKQTNICATGINPNQELKRPAFKYGDGLGYAKFTQVLPTDTSDYDVGTVTTALLPPMSSGAPITAGSDMTSSGVTLSVAAGASVKLDKLNFPTEENQRFRAVEMPMAKAPPAVDPALGFGMLIATTPLDTEFCPHARLSVPNTPAWPAGTEVEFWFHGTTADEEWAQYGSWAKVSGGKVSADGKSVITTDGEGIPMLGAFGIKKK